MFIELCNWRYFHTLSFFDEWAYFVQKALEAADYMCFDFSIKDITVFGLKSRYSLCIVFNEVETL